METISAPLHRRRSLRRSVDVETQLMSQWWDGPVALCASDLSQHGLWIDSDLALDVGEQVEVAFTPPRWQGLPRLRVRARVARVSLSRRRDQGRAGMGLAFDALPPTTQRRLARALQGLPPRLPLQALEPAPRSRAQDVLLDDGSPLQFRAEAALLSVPRPTIRVHWAVSAQLVHAACAQETAPVLSRLWPAGCERAASVTSPSRWLNSPMSAIFDCAPHAAETRGYAWASSSFSSL